MKTLQCAISNKELLDLYGYEPLGNGETVTSRWEELCVNWSPAKSKELGQLRQIMLMIHQECCPDDERWR